MACFVLAYHSHNIAGRDYASNDHVAFASDLRQLHRIGAEVVSLQRLAANRLFESGASAGKLYVGLSFDDGPVFDFADFTHPEFGEQRSFLNTMRDFRAEYGEGALPGLHATSFVIASPDARKAMETSPDCGYTYLRDWLADDWWPEAMATGLMDIGNHSWDHVHHAYPGVSIRSSARDSFLYVDDFQDAECEIRKATEYIERRIGTPPVFAYPFGHVNAYLANEYLPRHGASFGLAAAFGAGDAGGAPTLWSIPRAACGYNWRSPGELERLLAA